MVRRSIATEDVVHRNPIPAASRIGPFVASGVINARDGGGGMPVELHVQAARVFEKVQAVMKAAGGSVDDILKVNFQLADPDDREALNAEWVRMFPDPDTRPTRQTMHAVLPAGTLIQCDLLAIVDTGTDGA